MSKEWLIQVKGFIRRGDARIPAEVGVSTPESVDGETEYRCRIRLSPFLRREVEIAGMDSQQAEKLATAFAKSIIGDELLEDEAGQGIQW
ncbi:hypothetical protein L0938_13555 [Paracidovorax citrulli]